MPGLIENVIGGASNWINNALFDPGSKDRKMQAAFAKNAIQWKVADANKAGVHPLYALGAPTMNYSPVSVGGGGYGGGSISGQDISRAIGAGMPKSGQLSAYEQAVQDLTLQGMGLDNEYKAAQLARLRNEMLNKPALPEIKLPGPVPFQTGDSSKSQVVQDEYGDLIENVYGTGRLIYDSFTNLDKMMGGKFLGSRWGSGPVQRAYSSRPPSYPSYGYSKTGRR